MEALTVSKTKELKGVREYAVPRVLLLISSTKPLPDREA